MRLAFVVRLGTDTRPSKGLLEGWVEEVDSGTELRFRSSDELLNFLGERFDLAMDGKPFEPDGKRTAPIENKSSCKARKPPRR